MPDREAGDAHGIPSLGPDGAIQNAMTAFDEYAAVLHDRFGTPFPEFAYERSPSWPDFVHVGLVCSARGWDPAEYVAFAFGAAFRSVSAVTPHDLASSRMMRAFDNRPAVSHESPKDMYRKCVELLVARECGDSGSDERDLLMSPMSAFPAWFRVFYPESLDMDIIGAWGPIAKTELSASRDLVEFLQGVDASKWTKLRKVLWGYGPMSKGGAE